MEPITKSKNLKPPLWDEYDARDAVEYYLERTAGMEEGTYELDSGGKVIAVLND